jgi:hydroxyacylglutathione hydrolase
MEIKQFEDKGLSHYSYAILSESAKEIVLIDPARDVSQYLDYAKKHQSLIIGIIETHPHADFVSGHLELHKTTGATIYCSNLVGVAYPHQTFDDADVISFGKIRLKALNTPGHSPDSICVILEHEGRNKAVFTGDTLFIGDCGRPDLRESAGNQTAKRDELARQMYHSLRDKLMVLEDSVLVYPAHGAGTLCGKALSQDNQSTIGAEKTSNWSLQKMSEDDFVVALNADQPFIPKYFPYDVELNRKGANNLAEAISQISRGEQATPDTSIIIIDTRPEAAFKKEHLRGSINLQDGNKFETWLGSILTPEERFYLIAESEEVLDSLILRCAKIGYESFIESAFVFRKGNEMTAPIDIERFKMNPADYTIVDIRNASEVNEHPVFENAVPIPLSELRERIMEIPLHKPIVVHCAGGYRSAAGSSIVQRAVDHKASVFDLGEHIKAFL